MSRVQTLSEADRALGVVNGRLDLIHEVATDRDATEGPTVFALISLGHAVRNAVEVVQIQGQLDARSRLETLFENNESLLEVAVEWADWDSRQQNLIKIVSPGKED